MLSTAKFRKSCLLVIPALVILMTLGLFPAGGFSASPYTFSPTADTYVWSALPNNNFGNDYNLIVQTNCYTYLKFDLSSIPANEQVTGGTLYLYCNYGYKPFLFSVELRTLADNSWTETGVTWNSKPDPAYGSLIYTDDSGRQGEYRPFTVGAAYLPRGVVSYALKLAYGQSAYYNSRNTTANPPYKPYLVVTTKKKPMASVANTLLLLDE
jgi:hypothetical protein